MSYYIVRLCRFGFSLVALLALLGSQAQANQSRGRVVAWGDNTSGQTNVPPNQTNAVAISAGSGHSMALSLDGTVRVWGDNTFGQTNVPAGLTTNVMGISAGWNHCLALRLDGRVVAWGNGASGQTNVPPSATNVTVVGGGWKHSAALRNDGRVVAWGNNANGQTNVPASLTNATGLAVGRSHTVALKSDGRVVAWGDNTYGQTNVPASLSNVIAVGAGANYSVALKSDGKLVAWGNNGFGQTNVASLTNLVRISAGSEFGLAIRSGGNIVSWGATVSGQRNVPASVTNAFAVAGGKDYSMAIVQFQPPVTLVVTSKYSTAVPAVGSNGYSYGTAVNAFVSQTNVTVGGTQAFLLGWSGTGSVPEGGTSNSVGFTMVNDSSLTWNWQEYFWLDTTNTGGGTIDTADGWYISGTNVTMNASALGAQSFIGWFGHTNGCTINGTALTAPMTQARGIEARFTAPIIVAQPSSLSFTGEVFSSICGKTLTISNSGNGPLSYSLTSDMFWLSVDNPAGDLAAGMATTHVVNVSSLGLDPRTYWGYLTITDVLATNNPQRVPVSLRVKPIVTPSKVFAWGDDGSGQTDVPCDLTNAVSVFSGYGYSMSLRDNGSVSVWGDNQYGQTNVPSGLTNVVAVAPGSFHELALRSNGTVVAWGWNDNGQTNVPSGLSNVVAVAAGLSHSMALRADGTVVAWGNNNYNQTNVPPTLSNVVAISAGSFHSMALCGNGSVVVWGRNSDNQTNVPVEVTNAVAIAGGHAHSMALLSSGNVVAWGRNSNNQTNVPAEVVNAVGIAAGTYNSMALTADGVVLPWGDNSWGQTNVPSELTNAVDISSGTYHSLALAPAQSLIVTSDHGCPDPDVGTNWLIRGSEQWLTVNQEVTNCGTLYVNTGWTGTGDVPSCGTSNTVGINYVCQDSTINWRWETNFWLDIYVTNAGGYTDVTNGWFLSGTNVMATATTNNGYDFTGWFGDTNGCTINGTDITIPMTNARDIEARFNVHVEIGLYPFAMNFTGQVFGVIGDQSLVVSNAGVETLDYLVTPDAVWLSVDNPMGTLAPGESTSHVVHASSRGLGPWTYDGSLLITDVNMCRTWTNEPVTLSLETAVTQPNMILGWGDNGSGQTNIPWGLTNVMRLGRGNGYHSLAVRTDGTVAAWGNNSLLQAAVPAEATNVVAAAVGWTHSVAVRDDGSVLAWGYNGQSQTNVPAGLSNVVDVAAGVYHTLALTWDGTVAGWGGNGVGQLNIPAGLTDAEDVAAGVNHSLALRKNGLVLAWGDNTYGQTNVPCYLTNVVAIAAGSFHSLALRTDGTVVGWGDDSYGQTDVPCYLTNVIAIAAGVYHSVALRADHTLVVWGDNSYGQSNFPAGLTNVVDISGGGYHSLALVPAASLTVTSAHGGNPFPVVGTNLFVNGFEVPMGVDSVVENGGTQYVNTGWVGYGNVPESDTSNSYTTVLTTDSAIDWQWGTNYFLTDYSTGGGSVTTNDGWYSAGSGVSLTATAEEGFDFLGWFGDTNNASINGTDISFWMDQARTIEARFTSPLILTQSGTLSFTGQVYDTAIGPQSVTVSNIGAGPMSYTITPNVPWLNVTNPVGSLAAGQSTTHIVRAYSRGIEANRTYRGKLFVVDSRSPNSPQSVPATITLRSPAIPPTLVVAWGNNGFGQTNVPTTPPLLTNGVQVSGGGIHSLALRANGRVSGWGANVDDQISIPSDLTNAIQTAAGYNHSLALRSNGTVVAWGQDDFDQASVPNGLTNVVDIDAGRFFSAAVRTNGTVSMWGVNSDGQMIVPSDATNVISIAAGDAHVLALRADGTVVAWGNDDDDQTDVPEDLTNAVAIDAGGNFSVALRANGTVTVWGNNDDGETNGIPGLTDVIAIAAGDDHVLALRSDKTVVSWGYNGTGQTNVPAGMSDVVGISGGGAHSLALALAQRLVVQSAYGSPEPATGTNWVLRGGTRTLSVATPITDGGTQLVNEGWIGLGSVPSSGTSNSVTVTITTNSTIGWRWTTNFWLDVQATGGGIVNTNDSWQRSDTNVLVLATNLPGQTFVGWFGDTNGCTTNGFLITVPMTQARFIEARFQGTPGYALVPTSMTFTGLVYTAISSQTLTITNSGDTPLSFWFNSDVFWLSIDNPTGSLAVGQSTALVVRASSRGLDARTYQGHLSLTTDPAVTNSQQTVLVNFALNSVVPPSRVAAWGANASGQTNVPSGLTNAIAVSGGSDHSVALRVNGRVVAWGLNAAGQTNVPASLSNAIAIAAGWNHTLALRSNGTVVAWGNNARGQTNVPAGLANVISIGAGWKHSGALRSNGTVAVWGDNSVGQTNIPAGLSNVFALAVGRTHNLALRTDGRVVAWGDNTYGQTNVPASLTNVVAVDAGANFSVALKADGTLVAWGLGSLGQTNLPVGLTNVMAVDVGSDHGMALKAGGRIVSWGSNANGQTNVPATVTNVVDISGGKDHSMALISVAPLGGGGGGMVAGVVELGVDGSVPQTWLEKNGVESDTLDKDVDGDGLTAMEEYVAGVDPNDASSTFRIVAVSTESGASVVSFESAADRVYTLEVLTDVTTGVWTEVAGQVGVAGNGSTLTLTDATPSAGPHYYRVRVSIP